MLIAVRATHDRLGLKGIEQLTRGSENLDTAIAELNEQHPEQPLTGWVVMATCNRLEIYLDADRFHEAVKLISQAVAKTSALPLEVVTKILVADAGTGSVRHMYKVAAGLDSQVLGEAEITGQVRTSFSTALAAGHTTTLLNDVFQGAMRTAKQVASQTKVGAAGRSSVAVALDNAQLFASELKGQEALIIGTGAMARVASSELRSRSIAKLFVYSPSDRAENFAHTHQAQMVKESELSKVLAKVKVVIAASGAGTLVVRPCNLIPALTSRYTPEDLVILDLALHSDVDNAIGGFSGVKLLQLEQISANDVSLSELEHANELIEAGITRFGERQQIRAVDPAVSQLRANVKDLINQETAQVAALAGEEVAKIVEQSLRRVYNKLLHSPMVRAQELAKEGQAAQFMAAVHTIFGVDVAGSLSIAPSEQLNIPKTTAAKQPPMTIQEIESAMNEVTFNRNLANKSAGDDGNQN